MKNEKLKEKKEILKEKLDKFLKTNRCKVKFYYNVKHVGTTTIDSVIDYAINTPNDLISCAFNWQNACESKIFWIDIDEKWRNNEL